MLLRRLAVENLGPYSDSAVLDFSVETSRPITMIGGHNGAGKTTLLNSIPLVLYGNRAKSVFGASAYPEFLNELIHHGRDEASATLEFDRRERGKTARFKVHREWSRSNNGKSIDEVSVWVDEKHRPDLESIWPEFVDGVLPLSVSGLAIFDGEKIERLADSRFSSEVLKSSLHGLLGLDLIDRLDQDLSTFKRRLAPQIVGADSALLNQIKLTESLISKQMNEIQRRQSEVKVRQDQLAETSFALAELTAAFESASGKLFLDREAILSEQLLARSEVSALERQLEALVARDLPILMLRPLLGKVAEMGDRRRIADETSILLVRMKERDEKLLNHLKDSVTSISSAAIEELDSFLRTDRASYDAAHNVVFVVADSATREAKGLLGAHGIELQEQLGIILQQLNEAMEVADSANRIMELVPSSDSLSESINALSIAESKRSKAENELVKTEEELAKANKELSALQAKVKDLASELIESGARGSDTVRIAREAELARTTLVRFSNRVVERHVGEIAKEITHALSSLLRKEKLISNVTIDPKSFDLALFGRSGERINPERLSAGERQMVATATLWGLAKSTGRTLPAIIDTPVGRLDHSHRANLVERYFPYASRQVVLFSTDEEVVGSHLLNLKKFVGASYLLTYDQNLDATTIREGYFE